MTMTATPCFTIITSTWNAAATLPRLLDSLAAQTCRDFNWIVQDGASSDATLDIVERYRDRLPEILTAGGRDNGIYDAWNNGKVEESIFAYVNGHGTERTLVIVNNQFERVSANIKLSCPKLRKESDGNETVTVSLAENLGLHFGGRHYLVWDNFSTGLTYLMPSIKLYEEGYNFTIDGYDSRVLWNIREVEDFDGSYEKLYRFLDGGGVKNINVALTLLRLKPVYKEMEDLRSDNFFSLLEDLLYARGNAASERKLLLLIAQTFTRLNAVAETFDESVMAALPQAPRDIDPAEMVSQIRALNRLMHAEGENVYASFARLTPETSLVIAAAIALKPFFTVKEATVRDAMKASDMLLLQHFFEDRKEALHYSDSDMHQLMHLAAFFCVAGYLMADKLSEKPIDILAYLLADEDIRKVANVNEYQGVTWYNKEMMQLIIVLAAISAEVFLADSHNGFDGQAFIADLLEREEKSGYKLEVLLSPVIEEKRREKELKEAADKAKANRRKASSTRTAKTKK